MFIGVMGTFERAGDHTIYKSSLLINRVICCSKDREKVRKALLNSEINGEVPVWKFNQVLRAWHTNTYNAFLKILEVKEL